MFIPEPWNEPDAAVVIDHCLCNAKTLTWFRTVYSTLDLSDLDHPRYCVARQSLSAIPREENLTVHSSRVFKNDNGKVIQHDGSGPYVFRSVQFSMGADGVFTHGEVLVRNRRGWLFFLPLIIHPDYSEKILLSNAFNQAQTKNYLV